ncbi:hypothetical protein EW145_g6060, partial [Phellinidium pouzarii]
MSQTFTPVEVVDTEKEKGWAANIGMMDWDTTNIVFTKRTLVEFLKYTGTTVDTNFMNISKLPKYAKFGKISREEAAVVKDTMKAEPETIGSVQILTSEFNQASDFRPSRRVRTTPGGPTSDIFGVESADDASAQAPLLTSAAMSDKPTDGTILAHEVDDEPDRAHGAKRPSRLFIY